MQNAQAIQQTAIELAERARLGDQVAMGTLAMVRINAKKGDPRAKYTLAFLTKWIEQNPPETNKFGAELLVPSAQKELVILSHAIQTENPEEYSTAVLALVPSKGLPALECAAVTLANGPNIFEHAGQERVVAISDALPEGMERKAFLFGLSNSGKLSKLAAIAARVMPAVNRAMQLGFAVGLARRIQGVRLNNVPIALLSSSAAWELGE